LFASLLIAEKSRKYEMTQKLFLLIFLSIIGAALPAQAQNEMPVEPKSMASFIHYVWQANPAITEAEARVLEAKAKQKAASKWRYNPEIEGVFEDVDGEDKTKQLALSQTIDWSGKFLSSGKTAAFELQAVEADRDGVRQTVTLGVLSALADFRTTKDIFDLAIKRISLMERFSDLAERSFNAGDIDKSEYNLAQLALSEALIVQADVETTLSESKQELNSSIGFPIENNFPLPVLPKILPTLPEVLNEDKILMSLPMLRAMKSREEAAKAVITEARKDRLPDPTIGLVGGKDSGADMIGLSVSVPLHVFNTYGAEVDAAKAGAIAEAKARQNALHAAKERLQSARRSYQLSRKTWINWQASGAQALSEQVDILDQKFKVGDLNASDYLVQIEQALDTQVAAEELHRKVWRSWFLWLRASGTVEHWFQNLKENSKENSGEQE
jgi:cobalt-zinc-cadmium efflux system outer membrane protein